MNKLDAVILAGGVGETMFPLTSQETRHFLPIQGKPLISFSLELVLKNHFKNLIIVVNRNNESKIRNYIHSKFKHEKIPKVKINFFVADDFSSLTEVISEMITQYIIQRDFVLLYGDSITNIPLTDLIDSHYLNGNHITCGMLDKNIKIDALKKAKVKKIINVGEKPLLVMMTNKEEEKLSKKEENEKYFKMRQNEKIPKKNVKKKNMKSLNDMEPSTKMSPQSLSIVKLVSKETLNTKGLSLKLNLAQELANVSMRADLCLGNIFLISKQIFPILVHLAPKFGSFSEELLPFIIDYQKNPKVLNYFGKEGALRLMQEKMATSNQNMDEKPKSSGTIIGSIEGSDLGVGEDLSRNRNYVASSDNIEIKIRGNSLSNQRPLPNLFTVSKIDENDPNQFPEYSSIWNNETQFAKSSQVNRLKIGAHIFQNYYKRINNMDQYKNICLEALKSAAIFPLYQRTRNTLAARDFTSDEKKQLGLGVSFISSVTHFSEIDSCKIKNSFIGNGVKIGKNCVIENSIILEGTDVNDGCVIKNSCIGANSRIQQDCKLTNIILGEMNLITKKKTYENDTLYMPQDNSNLLTGLEFVETRASRKFSQMG
jgi:NDP-sugar pyrophosphorylase family protein